MLIIGAGETAELTARALHDHGVATMFVANRRRERAIALAQRFGGDSGSFDALPAELARADIVVSSTSSPHALLGAEELALVIGGAAAGRCCCSTSPCRATSTPPAPSCPASRCSTSTTCRRRSRRHISVRQAEARRAEGIVEEEIQRSPAGSARSRCCRP